MIEAGLEDVVSCGIFVRYRKPMVTVKLGSATEGSGDEESGNMIVAVWGRVGRDAMRMTVWGSRAGRI